jgi:hypothetical protein
MVCLWQRLLMAIVAVRYTTRENTDAQRARYRGAAQAVTGTIFMIATYCIAQFATSMHIVNDITPFVTFAAAAATR